MNYTKGKWYIALNGKILIKTEQGFTEICQMPFGSAREADEMPEAQANAYLIAATPDMYEALKQIASCKSNVPGDVIDIAQKALAKAEGKND